MTLGIVTPLGTMLGPDIWGPPSYEWGRTLNWPHLAPAPGEERGQDRYGHEDQHSQMSSGSSYYETSSSASESGSDEDDESVIFARGAGRASCEYNGAGMQHQLSQHRGQATLHELNKDEKWTCPACGNENYNWRFVCNIRRCRQLKPKELLDCKLPKDAWVCFACGNLNFGHRRSCNMRNCKAPRDQVQM